MTPNVAFTQTTKNIAYTYDAAGWRLRKAYYNGSGTTTSDYANGFVYTNGELEYSSIPEGRVHMDATTYIYDYNLKDHLGNTMVCFTKGSDLENLQSKFEKHHPLSNNL